MSGPPDANASQLGRSLLVAVEQVCDQFEDAWRSGQRPRLEEFLKPPPGVSGETLFTELLAIELEMRSKAAEPLNLDDYRSRFSGHAARVESVFRRMGALRRLGDYELLEKLGHGGMGEVYRARQIHLNQIVALKVLPERYLLERQAVARFLREMQSIGGLNHPNIVRAYNAGEATGRHYLVMEYVEGVDLQRLVDERRAPLSIGTACEVLHQAALGLQHAHEHGLVHRDLKPANLILNHAGVLKILDFGLARFAASQLTQQLSQEGLAIGTVDYMAPEQAENSSSVDIRADIYSLGCTLFFLLAGRPPYGGKAYDTVRKKLMAHVVAPVPSLVDACPDCPEDLENILFHMMAKAPDERFDTPGELADALALFADPDELVACVPAVAPAPSANGATPGIAGTDPGSSRRVVRRSGERRKSSSSRLRRPRWYQRPVWWGALALVALVLFNLWMLLGNRREVAPVEPPTAAADEARQLAIELALLPGLNGQWWFDEMPWYLPFVRQAVAEKLVAAGDPAAVLGANPRGYLEPNIADVQKWLSDVVARCASALPPRQRTLLEELRSLSATNLSDTQLADRLERSLEHFVKSQSEKSASAVDLHTQALLQHKLAPWRNGQGFTERARVSYEAAQKRYAETAIPTGVPLQQLCLADAALLCTKVLGDFDEARQLFDKALTHDPLPPLFAAETRVAYGSAMASAGQYEDHLFVSAKKLLDECGASKRNHPLAARACEGYAWSLMDQWKVEDAGKQFQEAYNIRWSNKRAENPFATIYVFHNRHGTAITLRYRGNVESARRVFKTLVGDPTQVGEKNVAGEIPSALQEAEQASERPGQQRYLRDLRERWANSMERWADCELYGGAACGIPVNLARAASLYEKASTLNQDLDLGTKLVMTCKLCIVLALHGQTDAARKVFSAVEAGPKTVRGPDRERSELCRQVAQAVLRLKDALGPADGQKALRGFLDQFKLNPTYTDSSRRETLELQLFCAALLLSSDLETVQTEAAERDRKYLDPLLATFRGRKDMRPFLRGFYDLAIRACDKSDLVAVAQYLLEARAVDRQESLRSDRATLVLFHFSPDENFVVFLPQDGRPGKLVPLEVTREQIKSAASRGQRLRLPDELVKTIQGETQAGRALNVSWADTMCWASEDAGLADAEWPFADQLDLAALHASAHPSQPGDESR